jgi:hypothetical protein
MRLFHYMRLIYHMCLFLSRKIFSFPQKMKAIQNWPLVNGAGNRK